MSRKQRREHAEEHLAFIQNLPADQQILVDLSIKETKIFQIKVGIPPPVYEPRYEETDIHVVDGTTIQTVLDYKVDPEQLVTVLNFASATHPGGGWLRGSRAQDESLAMASTLFFPLSKVASKMYSLNEKDPKNGFYQDLIVYSPHVAVLKDDDNELLNTPVYMSVISVPAVNVGVVHEYTEKKRLDLYQIDSQIKKVMMSRCTAILKVAAKYNTDTLILGAFGCGVFRNNPNDVAWTFSQLLNKQFLGVFKKVIFAIPNDKNLGVFQQIFGETPI